MIIGNNQYRRLRDYYLWFIFSYLFLNLNQIGSIILATDTKKNSSTSCKENLVIDQNEELEEKTAFYQLVEQWQLIFFPKAIKQQQSIIKERFLDYCNFMVEEVTKAGLPEKVNCGSLQSVVQQELQEIIKKDNDPFRSLPSLSKAIFQISFIQTIQVIIRQLHDTTPEKDSVKKKLLAAYQLAINNIGYLKITDQSLKPLLLNVQKWATQYTFISFQNQNSDLEPLWEGVNYFNHLTTLMQAADNTFTKEQKKEIEGSYVSIKKIFEKGLADAFKKLTFFKEESTTPFNLQLNIQKSGESNFYTLYIKKWEEKVADAFTSNDQVNQDSAIALLDQFKKEISEVYESTFVALIFHRAKANKTHGSIQIDDLNFPIGTITTTDQLSSILPTLAQMIQLIYEQQNAQLGDEVPLWDSALSLTLYLLVGDAYLNYVHTNNIHVDLLPQIQEAIKKLKKQTLAKDDLLKKIIFTLPGSTNTQIQEDRKLSYDRYQSVRFKIDSYLNDIFQVQLTQTNRVLNRKALVKLYPKTIQAFSQYTSQVLDHITPEEKKNLVNNALDLDLQILFTPSVWDRIQLLAKQYDHDLEKGLLDRYLYSPVGNRKDSHVQQHPDLEAEGNNPYFSSRLEHTQSDDTQQATFEQSSPSQTTLPENNENAKKPYQTFTFLTVSLAILSILILTIHHLKKKKSQNALSNSSSKKPHQLEK